MANEIKTLQSNEIINTKKSYMLKEFCLNLCKFDTEKLDFAGLVFFTKKDMHDRDWPAFINSEMMAFEDYLQTLFEFKITSYVFSEEKQIYELYEHSEICLGENLLNCASDELFNHIVFSDLIKIDANAVFKKYNISYIFVRK